MSDKNFNSYIKQQLNYSNNQAYYYPKHLTQFDLTWLTTSSVSFTYLSPVEDSNLTVRTNSYQENYNINEYTIFTTKTAQEAEFNEIVINDNLQVGTDKRIANRYLMLFAIQDVNISKDIQNNRNHNPTSNLSFALYHQPKSRNDTTTGISIGKGSSGDVFLDTTLPIYTSYQFTKSARIMFWNSTTNFNFATILNVEEPNKITIKVDNNSSYGYSFSAGIQYDIIQLNKFRPYDISFANTNITNNYQLLTAGLRLNGSSNLTKFHYCNRIFSDAVTSIFSGSIGSNLYLPLYNYISPISRMALLHCQSFGGRMYFQDFFSQGSLGFMETNLFNFNMFPIKEPLFLVQVVSGGSSLIMATGFEEMLI